MPGRAVVLVQSLEPRLLLHAGHLHVGEATDPSIFAQLDAAQIERLGLTHAYEHHLAAQSLAAVTGQPPPAPSPAEGGPGPDEVGQWSAAQNWPRVSVHAILLPTGNVLFWDYNDNPALWNPTSGQITPAAPAGYNIFCAGHNLLPDGRVLVTGGHVVNGQGLPDASIYDPFTNTWERLPDMNLGRWYPTNTTLANGDALVVAGSYDPNYTNNRLPQVWPFEGDAWRDLTGAERVLPLYPFMFLAPNGKVFFAGESVTTRYIDTAGTGAWTTVANRVFNGVRNYGSAVMYDDGKILTMGGADPPTATAEVIDLNAPSPAWRAVDSLETQRRQINSTILADGQVLVTGGVSGPGFNNMSTPVYSAELWDPETETFRTMANMTRPRWYHSIAMLLPDGRVLSSGGDNNATAEVFSPDYLFKGPRPTIASAPQAVGYGESFTISTPDAANIDRVHLIRLASVTHAFNMDQRINRLSFTQAPGGLQIDAPSNPNLTPPGYYMLFILDEQGVPSVSKMVRVAPAASAEATDAQAAEEGSDGATITVARTGSTIGAMTVTYTIAGTATNGVDYASLSGTMVIPDGQTTATIHIMPIGDAIAEGTETVELTLESGPAHIVASGAGTAAVTIADTPPKVLGAVFGYLTLPHELRFDFTRDVSASLGVEDLAVQNLTTGQPVVPDSVEYDQANERAIFAFDAPLPDGNYRATLAGEGVADAFGTTLAADHEFEFFFLAGDANRDAVVNLDDFNILANNFGQGGRDYSQGDFTYDGLVGLADFNVLAGRFGTDLNASARPSRLGIGPQMRPSGELSPIANARREPNELLRTEDLPESL